MRLRNKKTGEIVRVEFLSNWQTDDGTEIGFRECNTNIVYSYTSLAELNEDWEDYEESKKYFWVDENGDIFDSSIHNDNTAKRKRIGNYFETKEEAEKAVERLKAWKRLKDKGFRFEGWDNTDHSTIHNFSLFVAIEDLENINKNLDLLFGGEDESN